MATLVASSSLRAAPGERPASSVAYDWANVATASCMGLGAYIDGWAHNHALATGGAIETFFTPWHALLYGGFGIVALLLIGSGLFWHARGYGWRDALPRGYGLSVAGVVIFAAGGVLDMVWHILFGIEASTAALLSPTHIVLVVGAVLIYMGPARSVLARPSTRISWAADGPLVMSLLWLLSSFTFFTQYASPFASTLAAAARKPAYMQWVDLFHALGVAGVALQAALLAGVVLYAVRLGRVPFGTFTVIFGVNVMLVTVMRVDMISVSPVLLTGAAVLAGLITDVLYRRLQPFAPAPSNLRIFAFFAPALLYASYFCTIVAFGGTYWSIHLLTGCVLTAGIIGYLMSYLLAGPQSA
ncbi:MAG: hypothetical protein ABR584_08605 [Candidatus Baltobacteraceae bacterium]